jgi:hypothetical protein
MLQWSPGFLMTTHFLVVTFQISPSGQLGGGVHSLMVALELHVEPPAHAEWYSASAYSVVPLPTLRLLPLIIPPGPLIHRSKILPCVVFWVASICTALVAVVT